MVRPVLLALIPLLAAAPAFADEAQATSNGLGAPTAASEPAAPTEIAAGQPDGLRDAPPPIDRKVHGEVSVAVGSGGYRSAYLALSAPLGERGYAGVAVGASRGGRGFYGSPMAYGEVLRRAAGPDCVTVERTDGAGDPTTPPPACVRPGP